jgi:prepilin-type N-terminal cleavage/methylation domain-containing protein
MRNNSGFTLTELLLASAISVIAAVTILTVFMMANRTWSESTANVALQSNGRLILNQLARGNKGQYGLREANYSTLAVEEEGRSIRFSVDQNEPPTYVTDDDTTCRFYLHNERIWYDPDTSVDGDECTLVNKGRVQDVIFTKDGSYVKIDLLMRDYASPRNEAYVKLSTNVFLRKARKVLH